MGHCRYQTFCGPRKNGPHKVYASISFKAFFWMDIFKVVAFEMADVMEDSDGDLLQRIGILLNKCKIELV